MNTFKNRVYVLGLLLILFTSCLKQKIKPETLEGKWEFSNYDLVIQSKGNGDYDTIDRRETINESGYIEFLNNDLNGVLQIDGNLKMPKNFGDPTSPSYNQTAPVMIESYFTMGEFVETDTKYNFKDSFFGTVKEADGDVIYDFMTIKQLSKKKIQIMIGRVDEANPNETNSKLIYIELKKA